MFCSRSDINRLLEVLGRDVDILSRSLCVHSKIRTARPGLLGAFEDIAEIVTSGQTLSEAFPNGCEALDLHLETLLKLGKRLPKVRHRLVMQSIG